jgi:hypothetical protein
MRLPVKIGLSLAGILVCLLFLINFGGGRAEETLSVVKSDLGNGISGWYLKIDTTKFDVRVVAARMPSVQSAAPERAPSGFSLEDYKRLYGALAVMSGGYLSSFAPPMPFGLVKSDNVLTSSTHKSWLTEGVYCAGPIKTIIELWNRNPNIEEFRDCLQSGPMLLYNGDAILDAGSRAPGYMRLAQDSQNQAFICTSSNNETIIGITEATDFSILIPFLKDKVGCINALRLTGRDTAGLIVNDILYGSDQYLLPNALAVVPRK